MGTVVNLTAFSSKQDKSWSKETPVLLENVLDQENLVPVKNGVFTAELKADLVTLSAMALRKKYPYEASVHKNRQSACKGKFAPEFKNFRSFLAHVGACPEPGWTLDRIDNKNPDYGPGLVRWASKTTQTRNRSNTIVLTVDGVSKPLAEWAEIRGVKVGTMLKRYQRHPNDHRKIVFGAPPAARDSVEGEWRALLPERMWPHWRYFEDSTVVDGSYLPAAFRSAGAGFIRKFTVGPRGRALRLYTTAGRHLAELNEKMADAQMYAEQFDIEPEGDPRELKAHAFWTEARDSAWRVLRGEVA